MAKVFKKWVEDDVVIVVGEIIEVIDAFVGTGNLATHADLNAVMADGDIVAGAKIYILTNQTLDTTQVLTKDNIELIFPPGVTYTKGSAETGLQISADGVRIRGGRFDNFTIGILIDSDSDYTMLRDIRFKDCDVSDLSSKSSILGNIIE